ncbi:MAG TPA: hypothetical protein VLN45_03410 [Ignavibacteriaceae bacterium]|nr:hypothetical protein [Ignavibacteriaceae bacterium]
MNGKEFISSWVSKLASANIKNFPADFISLTNFTELKLPGKTLLIGEEFFGKYEIITPDGNSVLHTENYLQAKFILYANRNTPELILIPKDESKIKNAVQKYESYIDSIIKEIEIDYKKTLPEEKNSKTVVNEIFRQLNLVRV